MSKTFVIADLHGRADLAREAVTQITESNHSGGKIIWLGDYIDRGYESKELIEFLMAGPQTPGWEWITLTGNHEQFMVKCGAAGKLLWKTNWLDNGGGPTLLSYGYKWGEVVNEIRLPQEHLRWMGNLKWYYEDEHRVYVHAGVNEDIPTLGEQPLQVLTWLRYGKEENPPAYNGKHIVHGHEQYEDGPLLHQNRTDLDTLAWYTGRLVVGVFDDNIEGGPVSFITVQGKHIKEMSEEFKRKWKEGTETE